MAGKKLAVGRAAPIFYLSQVWTFCKAWGVHLVGILPSKAPTLAPTSFQIESPVVNKISPRDGVSKSWMRIVSRCGDAYAVLSSGRR